jgi:cytochrome P450
VLGGRAPTFEELRLLPYTRMAIQEGLRMHPSAYAISRQAIADDEVHGFHIPAGSAMVAPQYYVHRDPRYWDNPEGFDPERFSPERSAQLPSYAYFPFGGGHFKCIAREMSMAELTMMTAIVAQRFRLNLVGDHRVWIDERWMLLAPRDGIVFTLRPRAAA